LKQQHLKINQNDIATNVTTSASAFEEMYIAIRDEEGRLYNDKQVAQLPDISAAHKYSREWKMRKRSSAQLITFLKKQNRPLNILEVGCGNGWLSARLAGIPHAKVTGLDPNRIEVEQAARVFNMPNLTFIHGVFNGDTFSKSTKFDIIVFAASIQYFPSLKQVFKDAFALLPETGRVHVLDTHFYHISELRTAAERSLSYYAALGFPEMAKHYFHHALKDVMYFKHKTMFNPATLINRLTRRGIFYWIKLKP
jgi:SAM-dependent methyltransferase